MNAAGRVFPPFFVPIGLQWQVITDYSVDAGEAKFNRVRERSSEFQVASKSAILGDGSRRHNSPCAVQTQHFSRVSGRNVGHHTVSTIELATPLAPPQSGQ